MPGAAHQNGRIAFVPPHFLAAMIVACLLVPWETRAEDVSKVKGALIFAGGELRFDNAPVWQRFIELAGGKDAPVVVVPAAASNPEKSGQAVVENLRRYGARAEMVRIAPNLESIPYKDAVADPANIRMLRAARGIWFIGGSQQRITRALLQDDKQRSKTPALEAIWDAYREGAVIGGSSAGTAIMSRWMFANPKESLGTLQHGIDKDAIDVGLGFLGDEWFVDQHFLTRGRFGRALRAMHHLHLTNGIGIDEDTAVVFRGGKFEVVGYKGALVLDLSDARVDNTLPDFNMKKARLTYLDAGDSMDARTRAVTVGKLKMGDRKIDPNARGFDPYYKAPEPVTDMLAAWAVYEAMVHALDSKTGEVMGLAFALRGDKKELGFEFRVYRGNDTVGWNTSRGGNERYSVQNIYLDITPVQMARPLYGPR
jgi:cyanophycinase